MKNIFRYLGAALALAFAFAATSCVSEEGLESANLGLTVKVFSPTKVIPGVAMTINGSGFANAEDPVVEVEFPGEVKVTALKIVTDGMIRLTVPAGIDPEGGSIIVRTAASEAASPLPLTVGNPTITGYSVQADGETVITGGDHLTIYGSDLEFIDYVELQDRDGNPLIIEDESFYRKGTSNVVIIIPKNIFEGTFAGKVYTLDGKYFTMPDFTYAAPADGGHWETQKTVIWTNPDPDGNGTVNWNGTYRFALDGTDGNNECIATFPEDVWDKMKAGTFYLEASIDADWYNVRLTTGWWSTTYSGGDIGAGDERLVLNEDGTKFVLAITLGEDADIMEVVDAQHLLFTGEGYTPLEIYFSEDVWVDGGGHEEIIRTSIWKNDGSKGSINWNGDYRFSNATNSTGEEIYAIPDDLWEQMKAGTFYLEASIDADWYNVRLTTGWWSTTYSGGDIGAGDERLVLNEDGTKFVLAITLGEDADIMEVVDAQHLLFTGEGYTPLELYFEETVWVGGDDSPKETLIWENDGSKGSINWNGDYRFSNATNSTGEEIYAIPDDLWEQMKAGTFYLEASIDADWYNVRLTTGWWSTTYSGGDIGAGDERLVLNEDGTKFVLAITLGEDADIMEVVDAQHLLFTGEGYTPLKLYIME